MCIHEYGPPEVLRYEDVPDPVPRQGEIRIKVHAATVNRVLDVSLRAGREQYRGPVLPLIPGVDCAGIVDAVGPQVGRWRAGDRVAAAGVMPLNICAEDGSGYNGPQGMMGIKRPGGFAEMIAVPACAAVAVPEHLDFHHAAVVMRHVPTAWNLLDARRRAEEGRDGADHGRRRQSRHHRHSDRQERGRRHRHRSGRLRRARQARHQSRRRLRHQLQHARTFATRS